MSRKIYEQILRNSGEGFLKVNAQKDENGNYIDFDIVDYNKSFVDILKKIDGEFDVVYKAARSVDVRKIVLDNSKIKQIYKGEIRTFETGVKEYYNYLTKKINTDKK